MHPKQKPFHRVAISLLTLTALSVWLPSAAQGQTSTIPVADGGAGVAASADSADTAFANPAGLVLFDEAQYTLGFTSVENDTTFEGSSFQIFGPRIFGSAESNAIDVRGSVFGAMPLNDRWHLGFGIHQPGSRNLFYDGILRFLTVKEKATIYTLGASVGYKVNDKLSVGVGLNAQYAEFWCNMFLPEHDNFVPTGADGYFTSYADDWELGYRLGLLYQFTPGSRIGLTYVSKMYQDLGGYSTYVSDAVPYRRGDGYTLEMRNPAFAVLSLHHDLNERWSILASVDYTFWDWDTVLLDNLVAPAPFTSLGGPFEWEETWGWAAGTAVRLNDRWTLTTGYRDEEGQTPDHTRGAKDYFSGHTSLGFGIDYEITDRVSLGMAYRHISGKDGQITAPGAFGEGTQTGEFGVVSWYENHLGFALNVRPKSKG